MQTALACYILMDRTLVETNLFYLSWFEDNEKCSNHKKGQITASSSRLMHASARVVVFVDDKSRCLDYLYKIQNVLGKIYFIFVLFSLDL